MVDSMRDRLEEIEGARLAPWALRSADATRRQPVKSDGRAFDYRTAFQRDRDRIVYSRAFRRLRQKAQAGILPEYEDHRRNRLTHTLEATQLARTIGRALQLNEDLVEAIALGHDLGQPPFGPTGERALHAILSGALDGRGGPAMGDLGGFHRAWQSLRVIDRLEKRYAHAGLNLTDPVREGIYKSDGEAAVGEPGEGLRPELAPSLEGQVVILADRIATVLHQLDDALQSGRVPLVQVERLAAVQQLKKKLGSAFPSRGGNFMKANAINRGLVHLLVTSAVVASGRALERFAAKHEIESHERFLECRDEAVSGREITLPPAGRKLLDELSGFIVSRVSRQREADLAEARGRRVLVGLFAAYHADPALLDDHVLFRYKEISGKPYLRDIPLDGSAQALAQYRTDRRFLRLLADHLAAMTDGFALSEFERLNGMGAIPIPSAEQLHRENNAATE